MIGWNIVANKVWMRKEPLDIMGVSMHVFAIAVKKNGDACNKDYQRYIDSWWNNNPCGPLPEYGKSMSGRRLFIHVEAYAQ